MKKKNGHYQICYSFMTAQYKTSFKWTILKILGKHLAWPAEALAWGWPKTTQSKQFKKPTSLKLRFHGLGVLFGYSSTFNSRCYSLKPWVTPNRKSMHGYTVTSRFSSERRESRDAKLSDAQKLHRQKARKTFINLSNPVGMPVPFSTLYILKVFFFFFATEK